MIKYLIRFINTPREYVVNTNNRPKCYEYNLAGFQRRTEGNLAM